MKPRYSRNRDWGVKPHWPPCIAHNFRMCRPILTNEVSYEPAQLAEQFDVSFIHLRHQLPKIFKKNQYFPSKVKGHQNSAYTVTYISRSFVKSSFIIIHQAIIKISSKQVLFVRLNQWKWRILSRDSGSVMWFISANNIVPFYHVIYLVTIFRTRTITWFFPSPPGYIRKSGSM